MPRGRLPTGTMDDDSYQKELFQFDEPKKPFSRLSTILPKPDLQGKVAVVVTLDRMVFIALGIVMAGVLVFAVGVETGKRRSQTRPTAAKAPPETAPRPGAVQAPARLPAGAPVPVAPAVAQGAAASPQKTFFNTTPAATSAQVGADKRAAATSLRTEAAQDLSKPYTIVAAAFTRRDTAQAGAELLKRDGFQAHVYFSSPYYLVCAGGYDDKNGARVQTDLRSIKRTYKDAYVKAR